MRTIRRRIGTDSGELAEGPLRIYSANALLVSPATFPADFFAEDDSPQRGANVPPSLVPCLTIRRTATKLKFICALPLGEFSPQLSRLAPLATLHMHSLVDTLLAEHGDLRRLGSVAPAAAHTGTRLRGAERRPVGGRLLYLRGFPDVTHHALEDRLAERLLMRHGLLRIDAKKSTRSMRDWRSKAST